MSETNNNLFWNRPRQSPDLKLTEMLWHDLKKTVRSQKK